MLAFGVLAGVVCVADGARELLLPIWLGAMLGLAGTGYWEAILLRPRRYILTTPVEGTRFFGDATGTPTFSISGGTLAKSGPKRA